MALLTKAQQRAVAKAWARNIKRREDAEASATDDGWKGAAEALTDALADERDYTLRLRAELTSAREYVVDALDAHEHSDGRELLQRIDAALADAGASPSPRQVVEQPREEP